MTPEETMRAASKKLRDAATAAQYDVATDTDFWGDYPAATAWHNGLVNGFGGVTGDYAALVSPAVGLAFADWLDTAARYASKYPADHQTATVFLADAFAAAQAILGIREEATA